MTVADSSLSEWAKASAPLGTLREISTYTKMRTGLDLKGTQLPSTL